MSKPILSSRTNSLVASPIRKFLPLVRQAEKRGIKVLKINIGDPDILPPPKFFQTLKKIKSGQVPYAPSSGLVEHVSAWQKYYAAYGLNFKPENLLPTIGAGEAILWSLLLVANPNDEIIVFEPLYTNYRGFAKMAQVKLVPITLQLADNFALPKKTEILKKISPKTKAIIIINPDNPTGKVWSDKELKMIVEIARQKNLFIIADETYREIVFTGRAKSILQQAAARPRTILIDSLSKRFSLPGARLGIIASYNLEMMSAALKLAMIRLSAPTIEQIACTPLIKDFRAYTKKIKTTYQKRSQIVNQALKKIPNVVSNTPAGAFYQVAKLPVKDTEDFIRFMLTKFSHKKQTILISPLKDFYITPGLGKNEVRIAYVLSADKLRTAMHIFKLGLEAYLKK
ncbi:MAG: pyridoxal phosphate-dependent aminotransferase [Patescibacteria group bacterium]